MSWLGAADVAVPQHLHTKHMFQCYLKKRQQNIICRPTGCLRGGCSGRKLGFSQGKSRGSLRSREVEDIQCTGQGLHGWIPGGTREEDIPWPSTYQCPPLPNLLHGSDSQARRVGMSWWIVIVLRRRERWNLCPGQAGPVIFHLKWAAMEGGQSPTHI